MKREKKIEGELTLTQKTRVTPGVFSGINRELCVKDSAIPSKWYEENLFDKKYPAKLVEYYNQCIAHSILPLASASLVAASVVCRKAYYSSTPEGFFPLFINPLY